jgi:hypothetical protein
MKKFGLRNHMIDAGDPQCIFDMECQRAKTEIGQTKSAPITDNLMMRRTPAFFAASINPISRFT